MCTVQARVCREGGWIGIWVLRGKPGILVDKEGGYSWDTPPLHTYAQGFHMQRSFEEKPWQQPFPTLIDPSFGGEGGGFFARLLFSWAHFRLLLLSRYSRSPQAISILKEKNPQFTRTEKAFSSFSFVSQLSRWLSSYYPEILLRPCLDKFIGLPSGGGGCSIFRARDYIAA